MNTQSNGDVNDVSLDPVTPAAPVAPVVAIPGEEEFVATLPTGQWLLTRVEPPKKWPGRVIVTEAPSPYVTVIAVGPEFRADVKPGDRVTYEQGVNLPKELIAVASWATKYRWVHENRFLGRLPRSVDEKQMATPTRPAPPPTEGSDVDAMVAFIAKARGELAAQGLGLDGKPLPAGHGG